MDKKTEKQARAERLKKARMRAGFSSAFAAADALGWNRETYKAHEVGRNGFDNDSGREYARRFKVDFAWLMTGEGPISTEDLTDDEREWLRLYRSATEDVREVHRRSLRTYLSEDDEDGQ